MPMMALLAIDDDRASRQAAYAAANWLPGDCQVVALHVGPSVADLVSMDSAGVGVSGSGYATFLASALPTDEELEATARQVAQSVLDSHGGTVRVERGDPASMICQVATEIGADLVVVGTGDRGFLARLVDPSVSSSVAGDAPCSVLIARSVQPDPDPDSDSGAPS